MAVLAARTALAVLAGIARGDAAGAGADVLAAFEGEAHLVGEHGALLFVQAEAAREFKFVGGLVVGLAQMGEQTFT